MKVSEAVQLLKSKLEGRQYGDEYVVKTCPFCGRSDGKFYLNTRTSMYSCKHGSCGAKGNATSLFAKLGISEQIEYDESYTPKNKPKKKLKLTEDVVDLNPEMEVVSYMKSRGISYETLVKANVKYYKTKRALLFPTYVNSELVAVSYRTIDKQIRIISGSEQHLWGYDNVDIKNKTLYVTEGRVDALTLLEMDIKNVVSLPNGVEASGWIENDWDFLQNFETIILCFDNDEAGAKGFEKVKNRLDFASLGVLEYGEYNDVNEMFMGDVEKLYATVRSPNIVDLDGFVSLQTVSTDKDPLANLTSCGLKQFDRIFGGFGYNQSTVICAPSGVGKTTVVCNLIRGLLSVGHKTAIWSGELNNSMLKTWLYAAIAGEKALGQIKNPYRQGAFIPFVKPEYEEKIDEAVDNRLFIYDGSNNDGFSMLRHFEVLHKRHGVQFFFIDNLTILSMAKNSDKYAGEDEFAKSLASFVKNNRVHVFTIAHPVKENINNDPNYITKNGTIKPVEKYNQYSVSGSKSIVNLAQNILFMQKANDHYKEWFKQVFRNQLGNGPELDNLTELISDELSLVAYLVKNRGAGYISEDALFGYSAATRRIYGLLSKEEDLNAEAIPQNVKDEGEFEYSLDEF